MNRTACDNRRGGARLPAEVNNIADVDLVARVVRHYGTGTLASLLRDRSCARSIIWANRGPSRCSTPCPAGSSTGARESPRRMNR